MKLVRVLLMEDDPTACALIKFFFQGFAGAELCAVANDGQEGLVLISSEQPDLVLLDLVMPRLSGLGVLRALRENPPPKKPNIVVISRVSSDEIIQRTFALGADFYLLKPVNLSELPEIIHSLFGGEGKSRGPVAGSAGWLLEQLQAPREELGYQYIAVVVEMLALDESGHMLLKEAYYPVIRNAGTSYQCVEKNIRSTIQKIHSAGSPAYRDLMGGLTERQPANSKFLHILAQEVRRKFKLEE